MDINKDRNRAKVTGKMINTHEYFNQLFQNTATHVHRVHSRW